MKLIKPSYEIITQEFPFGIMEQAGRTCYQSESKGDTKAFLKGILKRGHESVIEHSSLTVRFIIDRGVSHELVRHRLCAFSQESTRYCCYDDQVTFIIPPWVNIEAGEYGISTLFEIVTSKERIWYNQAKEAEKIWFRGVIFSEECYSGLLREDWSPQQARSVLPNSLKTDIVVTANFREWRHILKLRAAGTSGKPHPQMSEVMVPLLEELKGLIPVIFDDITL